MNNKLIEYIQKKVPQLKKDQRDLDSYINKFDDLRVELGKKAKKENLPIKEKMDYLKKLEDMLKVIERQRKQYYQKIREISNVIKRN